ARTALGEDGDDRDPRDVRGRGEVADAILAHVLAAHEREEHDAVEQIRAEDDVGDLGQERRLLGIDDDDRERAQREQHAAERDDARGARERPGGARPPFGSRTRERERLHRLNRWNGSKRQVSNSYATCCAATTAWRSPVYLAEAHEAEERQAHLTLWA